MTTIAKRCWQKQNNAFLFARQVFIRDDDVKKSVRKWGAPACEAEGRSIISFERAKKMPKMLKGKIILAILGQTNSEECAL